MAMSPIGSPVPPYPLLLTHHSLSQHVSSMPCTHCPSPLCTSWGLALENPGLLCVRTLGNRSIPKEWHYFLSSTHMWPTAGLVTTFPPAGLSLFPSAYPAACNPGRGMRLQAFLPKPLPHLCFELFHLLRYLCFSWKCLNQLIIIVIPFAFLLDLCDSPLLMPTNGSTNQCAS